MVLNNVKRSSALVVAVRQGLFLSVLGLSMPALAAPQEAAENPPSDASGEGDTLGEVVVTAQRRNQNIQDVPLAVSVISPAALDKLKIEDIQDIGRQVPSLTVSRSGKAPSIFMRGIGNNSFSPGQEQNIATYVDGVYYPSISANVFSFDNLERIEVLRGPQGTLFGRNSTGGVIQIVTKDPTQDPHGRLSVGYGNYDTTEISAFVSGGLSENLAANLGVRWHDQGEGWGTNVFDGSDVNMGRDVSARTKFVYTPSELTKITLGGFYSRTTQDFGSSRQMFPGAPTLPPSFGSISFTGSIYDRNANYPSWDRTEQTGVNLRWEQDLGFANLVSTSAHHVTEVTQQSDVDQSPIDRLHVEALDRTRSLSQEFQLQSKPESPIQWVGGFYYFTAEAGNIPQLQGGTLLAASGDRRIYGVQDTNSYSLFGQTTFPVFDDKTKLTLGARYTLDKKDFSGRIETGAGVISSASDSAEWDNVTYRVALDRDLNANTLAYASISTGFKSGVYNVVSITAPPVDPELLTSYEFGIKSDVLDKRLRLNAAAFYYDYRDIQLLRLLGATTLVQNAANAEIYGMEIEAIAKPIDGLTLNLGLSLLHSEYTDFTDAVANTPGSNGLGVTRFFDATGHELQRAPGSTANAGIDYSWQSSAGYYSVGGSVYRNGGFYWDPENRLEQAPYTLADAYLRWNSATNGLQVQLWAKNLFGKEYYAYATSSSGSPDTGAPGAPRTYGVTISYDF